jgi:hypothetical protein
MAVFFYLHLCLKLIKRIWTFKCDMVLVIIQYTVDSYIEDLDLTICSTRNCTFKCDMVLVIIQHTVDTFIEIDSLELIRYLLAGKII